VVQARPNLPHQVGGIVWFGSGAAHSTAFVPILAGMTSSPDCLLFGWQGVYNQSTSYWAHRNVLNLAQVKFSAMIVDIRALQTTLETESQRLVDAVSVKYSASKGLSAADQQHITTLFTRNAERAQTAFTELLHILLFNYGNNYLNAWSSTGFHSASTGM
jgi:dipeptidase